MKRYFILILAALLLTGCATAPERKEELRTRSIECPVDSLFTEKAADAMFSITDEIKPRTMIADLRAEEETQTPGYRRGITLYVTIALGLLALYLAIRLLVSLLFPVR